MQECDGGQYDVTLPKHVGRVCIHDATLYCL